MIANYFKTALRNIRKNRGFTIINISGLAMGLACCLLMLLYVSNELSFDRYHRNSGRIFRVITNPDDGRSSAFIPALPDFDQEFPEVEKSTRLFSYSWMEKTLVSIGEKFFYEDRFFLAEPSLFEIFDIPFIKGDAASSLSSPNSIVISQSTAEDYFPGQDPMGKTLSVTNLGRTEFIITGIIKDMPSNSHFRCDLIAPLESGPQLFWEDFLTRNSFYTYILLHKNADPANLEIKLSSFIEKNLGERSKYYQLSLQPLTDIHLRSHLSGEIETNSEIRHIYIFSALALIIMLVACANYINLSTARSSKRALEVGLRKVVGADRPHLIRQFMGESLFTAFIALPIALLLAEALLPSFNSIVKREMTLNPISNLPLLLGTLAITFTVGLISGSYPAVVLSSFHPIKVLKGQFRSGSSKSIFRNILVTAQYTVSTILIAGTLIVSSQMHYISNKDLGFKKDHIVIVPLKDYESTQSYNLVRTAFLQVPGVLNVTASRSLASEIRATHPIEYEGADSGRDLEMIWNAVDYDFIDTFGMQLVSGRNFSREFGSDELNAYIINETAAAALDWEDPIGKKFTLSNKGLRRAIFGDGRIIGVVSDFHFRSLHQKIEPLVLNIYPSQFRQAAVKISGTGIRETLDALATQWSKVNPSRPFDFTFFDEQVERLYQEDQRTGRILSYASILSILIACLGLFGLSAFSVAQRTKEIGIRKVLGASFRDISLLLTRDFTILVLAANLIAWPAAYFMMRRWMDNFAYRTSIGPEIFIFSGLIGLTIALLTVSSQSIKAALADPIDSLKYE